MVSAKICSRNREAWITIKAHLQTVASYTTFCDLSGHKSRLIQRIVLLVHDISIFSLSCAPLFFMTNCKDHTPYATE